MNTFDCIPRAGGCVVSKNVMNKVAPVRWMVRHEPLNPMDNGWRVFSDMDTEEFVADSQNMTVVDYNTLCDIEPACIPVFALPVGSDVQLVIDDEGRRRWFESNSGDELLF